MKNGWKSPFPSINKWLEMEFQDVKNGPDDGDSSQRDLEKSTNVGVGHLTFRKAHATSPGPKKGHKNPCRIARPGTPFPTIYK